MHESLARFSRFGNRATPVALLIALLSGCASQAPSVQQYYTLQPFESDAVVAQGSVGVNEADLLINRVSVPAYLAQAGIITADTEGKVEWANYHLWAELPAVAIKRHLERCVLSDKASKRQPQRIDIEIHRFQGDGKGGAVFDGVWTTHSAANGATLGTFLFEYRRPQRGDGYGALATTLSQTVQQLCFDILAKTL